MLIWLSLLISLASVKAAKLTSISFILSFTESTNNMLQIKALPTQAKFYIGPLILLILAFFAYLFDSSLSELFIYKRSLVENGQYWRLVSSHFFHTNDNHFLLNGAAVILLWALHGQFYQPLTYGFIFLVCALITGIGIHYFSLNIEQYVGLSGVLHGFFVWGALHDIRAKERTGYLLLFGVIIKIAHEQFYGASADVEALIGASVATDAHLFGAIAGFIAFGCLLRMSAPTPKSSQ